MQGYFQNDGGNRLKLIGLSEAVGQDSQQSQNVDEEREREREGAREKTERKRRC